MSKSINQTRAIEKTVFQDILLNYVVWPGHVPKLNLLSLLAVSLLSDQTPVFQHEGCIWITTPKLSEEFLWRDSISSRIDEFPTPIRRRAVEYITSFLESSEDIVIQNLCPHVHIVSGGIAG
jgi:hypothetical protein